jgi:apolipoprotein D and lipocalin family protein
MAGYSATLPLPLEPVHAAPHGRTNSERQGTLPEAEERALIATAAIRRHESVAPRGWLSPWTAESRTTPDRLPEAGYRYTLNWCMDDQPVWLKIRAGQFAAMVLAVFEERLEQVGRDGTPQVIGIALHPYIVGQPYRLRALRGALATIAARRGEVWITTAGGVLDHVAALPEGSMRRGGKAAMDEADRPGTGKGGNRPLAALRAGLLALPLLAGCTVPTANVPQTVAAVELPRYIGSWYELARFPNRFQDGGGRNCTAVTATYTAREDGWIGVENRCLDGTAERVARGRAYVVEGSNGARLRVSFFWPFYGDYWVIGLDPEYRWAVVGAPGRDYLWVLSRTPELPAADYARAVGIAQVQGFDVGRLQRTPQR